MNEPEPDRAPLPVDGPPTDGPVVDVPTLMQGGAHYVYVHWAPSRPGAPDGYHAMVYRELLDSDGADDLPLPALVAEGRSPVWDRLWTVVRAVDPARPPTPETDPEGTRAHSALEIAVGRAVAASMTRRGLDTEPGAWTEEHQAAHDEAAATAWHAVMDLVAAAERRAIRLEDLAAAVADRRGAPRPPDHPASQR